MVGVGAGIPAGKSASPRLRWRGCTAGAGLAVGLPAPARVLGVSLQLGSLMRERRGVHFKRKYPNSDIYIDLK